MKKILISNLCGIGDLMRMEPIVRGVREKYPDCYLTVLTREGREVAFEKHPDVDAVFTLPVNRCNRRIQNGENPMAVLSEEVYLPIASLREAGFDIAITPPHHSDSSLNGLIEAKEYAGAYVDTFGSEKIEGNGARRLDAVMQMNAVERGEGVQESLTDLFFNVTEELSFSLADDARAPQFHLSLSDRLFAKSFLKEKGYRCGEKLFVFNFSSRSQERRWSVDKTAELADLTVQAFQTKIVFGGTEEEREQFYLPIQERMQHKAAVIMAAGETSFSEYAALIKRAHLLVSTDSAPMHLADCFQTPIVALFAEGTYMNEARPYQARHELVVKDRMANITVEEVFDKIAAIL